MRMESRRTYVDQERVETRKVDDAEDGPSERGSRSTPTDEE